MNKNYMGYDDTEPTDLIADNKWHVIKLKDVIPENTIGVHVSAVILPVYEIVKAEFRGCIDRPFRRVIMSAGPCYPNPSCMSFILPINKDRKIYYKIPQAEYKSLKMGIGGWFVESGISDMEPMKLLQEALYAG